MKKQYDIRYAGSFRNIVDLYHDGVLVNSTKKWDGDDLDSYIDYIKEHGYEKAYEESEVLEAKQEYENLLKHQLIKHVNDFYSLTFLGIKKECVNLVDKTFFNQFNKNNKFGYYKENDGSCVFFVTDENGKIIFSQINDNERKNQAFVKEFLCKQHLINIWETLIKDPDPYKEIFAKYLLNTYGIDEWESKWDYFSKHIMVLVELLYIIMFNKFVYKDYAVVAENYTANDLCVRTNMDIFESYRYLVFLIENPTDALKNLKKD